MIKQVYYIFFPQNSPVLSMLPGSYETGTAFRDVEEAVIYFSEIRAEKAFEQDPADGTEDSFKVENSAADEETESAIALINCIDYYRRVSFLQKEQDSELLRMLKMLKEAKKDLGVRLLMPEEKNANQNLLIDLMSCGFYDFWFLPALTRGLLQEILDTRRDFRAMEAY